MASVLLVAGANAAVPREKLTVEVVLSPAQVSGAEVDISAFVLAANGKVRGDDDMVFYGQPRPGNGSVALAASTAGRAEFQVDLTALPSSIEKIAFTATIHENRQKFGVFQHLKVIVKDAAGQSVLEATLAANGMLESALILGELYLRQGQWKFRAVGQGFAGGLKPLAEHFGVDISEPTPSASPPAPPPPAAAPAPKKPISLTKITLDKAKPTVSLDKKSEGFGEIRVNLNWNRGGAPAKSGGLLGGLFGGANKGIDLDVGCLYEMQDGTISAIQSLGNRFGSFHSDPFIELKGDDRTGAISEGEWLHINGQHWQRFKRIIVYAFIYEGVPNWAQTDAVVTIYVPNEAPLEIRLTEGGSLGMCGIVLLENIAGALRVNREVRYFKGHQELDQAYHWGLNWRAGSK